MSDAALAPPHTDWLHHRLTVSGPAATVTRFQRAAAGTGAIPWHLDLDHEEARLLAPMAAAGIDARVLAGELRAAVALHHQRVLEQGMRPAACPLDLHRLIPVPENLLRLGPDDPTGQRWLWENWGTLRPLRHVRRLDDVDRRLRRSARLDFEFFSADWTPWRAIARLRRDWPDLVLDVRPDYGDDGA